MGKKKPSLTDGVTMAYRAIEFRLRLLGSLSSWVSFNRLKKSLLILSLLTPPICSIGQNLVGLTGGVQFPGARYEILHQPQPLQRFLSFQAGAQMKVPFDVNLYFVPALRYHHRGYDVTFTLSNNLPDPDAIDNSLRMHTVETAFLLQYDLGKKATHPFIRFGPSLETHLAGTERFLKSNGEEVKRPVSFARGNYGKYTGNLLMEIGLETGSGWFLYGFYTYGGTNMSNRDYGPSIKLRSFGLNIGKFLNGKKIILDTRNIE